MGENTTGSGATGARLRRKLNRKQIQEILERNLKLYKDETSFVSYMVELAIYLLEYEYNWEESGVPPPAMGPVPPEEGETVPARVVKGNSEIFRGIEPPGKGKKIKTEVGCPHCGDEVIADDLVCPNCGNMIK
jgi:hypothetical protein